MSVPGDMAAMMEAATFESAFDAASMSMWLEDFSALRALFESWRAAGVTDLQSHLLEHPGSVEQCVACIKVLKVNRRTLELYRARTAAALIDRLGEIFRDDMFEQHVQELAHLWAGERHFSCQAVNYDLSGQRLEIHFSVQLLDDHRAPWDRVLVCIEDVTDRVRAEHARLHAERIVGDLFEHSPISLWVEDYSATRTVLAQAGVQDGQGVRNHFQSHPASALSCIDAIRVSDVNLRTVELFGAEHRGAMLGRLSEAAARDLLPQFADHVADLWDMKYRAQRECVWHTVAGTPRVVLLQASLLPGHERDWRRVLIAMTDITSRKAAESRANYLASHDMLTGLGNRAGFEQMLSTVRASNQWPLTVLVVDINGLKEANDRSGHRTGDALIVRTAQALRRALVKPAAAYRTGGDEFVLMLPGADQAGGDAMVARILAEIEADNQQSSAGPALSLSIGHATAEGLSTWDGTLHAADQRMYAAKRRHYAGIGQDRRSIAYTDGPRAARSLPLLRPIF